MIGCDIVNSVMPIFAIVILSGNDYSTVNTATQLQIVMMLLYVLAIDFRRHNHVDVCLTAVRSKIDVMSRLLFFCTTVSLFGNNVRKATKTGNGKRDNSGDRSVDR